MLSHFDKSFEVELLMKQKSIKRHHHGLILFLILLAILLGVLAFSYRQFATKQIHPIQTTQVKKVPVNSNAKSAAIVGAYRDDQDGAAIVFNENGTGRYVYADHRNSDTNDTLVWHKEKNNQYSIILKDKDVTNPLTATLDHDQLTVTGHDGWNPETFQRTDRHLDLQQFLTEMHQK